MMSLNSLILGPLPPKCWDYIKMHFEDRFRRKPSVVDILSFSGSETVGGIFDDGCLQKDPVSPCYKGEASTGLCLDGQALPPISLNTCKDNAGRA